MAAISWSRTAATTTVTKSPKISFALTQSAAGDDDVIIDAYIEESADADYATDTIMCRFVGKVVIAGGKVVLELTPKLWDGNDAYVSATNPASSAAPTTLSMFKLPVCNDIDAFYTAGGFPKTDPA